ncbi:MAG: sugar transferase [Micavibrio sp.]
MTSVDMASVSETYYAPSRSYWKFLQEKQIHFLVFLLDLIALIVAYQLSLPLASSLIEYFHTSSQDSFHPAAEMRQIVYFCLSLGILFFLFLNGHYSQRVPWWSQLQQIGKVVIFAVLVDVFTSYALELHYSRIFIATNWTVVLGMILLTRLGANIIKCHSGAWELPAVIIADADTATDTLYALASDRGMGLTAQTIFLRNKKSGTIDREELPARYKNINVLTDRDDYENYIDNNPHFFYIVSLESFRDSRRDRLVKLFHRKGIGFALIPSISRTGTYQSEPHYFFGNDIMLLNTRKPAAPLCGRVLKRSMDIAGAAIALSIFLIPMLLVALMLKLEGQGGSPLYAGTRIGQKGRPFRCWKFRTMEPGTDHLLHEYLAANPEAKAHWDRYFKIPNDPRVQTRTARFIRKASIDELPQVWNVLKGEMSLVGPRPILENEIAAYGDRIDEYNSVKPGITGLWQTSGRNGTSFRRRVVWDSWYIRNWTFWGDIIIILKTIQVVLNKSGAS